MRVHLDLKHLYNLSLDGELNGHDLLVPLNSKTPLRVNALALKGDRHTILLKSADLSWSGMRLNMSGRVEPRSYKHLWLDLDINADSVDVDHLIQTLKGQNDHPDQKSAAGSPSLPAQGNIRFKTERLKISKVTVQPLQADISLQNDVAAITLKEARVCGIATSGTLKVSLPNLQFDLKPAARDQELNTTLNCLANETLSIAISFSGFASCSNFRSFDPVRYIPSELQ